MNFRKYVLMAAVCCLSVIFVSCDKEDDLSPSMAELNIEKLQSYHAAYISVIGEEIGYIGVKDYQIESPYLIVTSDEGYIYSIDMNNVSAFQYDKSDNSVTIMICIYNHRTTKTNQKYPSVNL